MQLAQVSATCRDRVRPARAGVTGVATVVASLAANRAASREGCLSVRTPCRRRGNSSGVPAFLPL
eukprot:2600471-Prymnesium_polylepis.1